MSTITGDDKKFVTEANEQEERGSSSSNGFPFSIMVAPGILAIVWIVAFIILLIKTT